MKKTQTIILFLIVCCSGLLMIYNLTPGHDWGGDFAAYIMQAKSLVEEAPSAFVQSNSFTIIQSSSPLGPVAYPWGYPALLAPLYAIFGQNILPLKTVGVISYVLFLVVLCYMFRRNHSTLWCVFIVSLFAFNGNFVYFSDKIFSDLPFLLVSTICIFLIREILIYDRYFITRRLSLVFVGIGFAIAFVIRTNGILLLLVFVLSCYISFFQKQTCSILPKSMPKVTSIRRQPSLCRLSSPELIIDMLLPCCTFLFFVIIWKSVLPEGGGGHINHLKCISAEIILENLIYYSKLPSRFFSGVPYYPLIYIATIPFTIAGILRRYQDDYPTIIYIVLTLLLYILWPAQQGLRFLFPILPFYISFACSGVEAFGSFATAIYKKVGRVLSFLSGVFLVIYILFNINDIVDNHKNNIEVANGPFSAASQEMFSFVTNHTQLDGIIVFFKPRVMKFITGRQAVMIDEVEQLFCKDFLVMYQRGGKISQIDNDEVKLLLANEKIRMVFKNNNFKIFQITELAENDCGLASYYLHQWPNTTTLKDGLNHCVGESVAD